MKSEIRKAITFKVAVTQNQSLAGKWLGWRDLNISCKLSDGGKYDFGFLIGSTYDTKQIYGLFKVFLTQKNISLA